MWHRRLLILVGLLLWGLAVNARAGFDEDLAVLQERWATVRYQTPAGERKTLLAQLIKDIDALTEKNSGSAEVWLWSAVIRGSLAEATGNLSALGLAKEAKTALEKAIAINGKVEDGYAYGVLGQMYAKVPGWPIGYGDKKKAREYLQQGLAISPNGVDSNYFYAQFLFEQGDYKAAKQYAERAETAPPRPKSPAAADQGRRREIQELLDKTDKHIQ